jgi:hypothetical protein
MNIWLELAATTCMNDTASCSSSTRVVIGVGGTEGGTVCREHGAGRRTFCSSGLVCSGRQESRWSRGGGGSRGGPMPSASGSGSARSGAVSLVRRRRRRYPWQRRRGQGCGRPDRADLLGAAGVDGSGTAGSDRSARAWGWCPAGRWRRLGDGGGDGAGWGWRRREMGWRRRGMGGGDGAGLLVSAGYLENLGFRRGTWKNSLQKIFGRGLRKFLPGTPYFVHCPSCSNTMQ